MALFVSQIHFWDENKNAKKRIQECKWGKGERREQQQPEEERND